MIALFEEANGLMEKVKMDFSVQEEQFLIKSLATHAIPSPKIIIKDHKTINGKGEFPTRSVTLAKNLTTNLSKLGYLGIKIILSKAKANYSRVSTVQASNMKDRL